MCFIIPSNDRSGRGSRKQMLGLIHGANTSEEFWSAGEALEHPDTWVKHLKSRKSIKSFIYLVSIIYFCIPINFACMYVCVQSCPTLCDPMDCSPPGPSVHGILQARILEWIAISYSRGSSRPRNQTWISCISCNAGGLFPTEPSLPNTWRASLL